MIKNTSREMEILAFLLSMWYIFIALHSHNSIKDHIMKNDITDILEETRKSLARIKNASMVAITPTQEEISMQEKLKLSPTSFDGIEPMQVSGIMPKHKDQVK